MTDRLRESQPGAVHASRLEPLSQAGIRRTLVVSASVGVFLSFVEAFDSGHVAFLPRTAFMVTLGLAGALLGMVSFRLASLIPLTRRGLVVHTAISGTLMTPLMGLLVWGAVGFVSSGRAHSRELPQYMLITWVMCLAISGLAIFVSHRRMAAQAPTVAPAPVKFLERLPLKLRGAEIWAVEAQDHYLRLHTSKGQDLILMRLADAVAELAGIEGAQVHRSWWVARDAVADARRGDGRATLTLKDGSEVPVSRTYAKLIREAGWI
ncbi:LytTR family DNA-binding domain-containing protein [Phenylobacterium ferrooxidans]|uniref:LytTR family transcriptional regulator DNA-binding domain-containing protein n=1 Tax=Phenylobacterium ferrooxidans TaxID=2982689 RepID=A0ABW6CK61_9CAUL